MFDFTPVGLGLSPAGVAVPRARLPAAAAGSAGAPALGEAIDIRDYVTEARVKEDSAIAGQTVSELRKHADQEVTVTAVVRDEQTAAPLPDIDAAGETTSCCCKASPTRWSAPWPARTSSSKARTRDQPAAKTGDEEIGVHRGGRSARTRSLIGQAAGRIALHERFNVNLLAVSRSGERFTERLRDIELAGRRRDRAAGRAGAHAGAAARARLPAAGRARSSGSAACAAD